jgi:hypothetical protein
LDENSDYYFQIVNLCELRDGFFFSVLIVECLKNQSTFSVTCISDHS